MWSADHGSTRDIKPSTSRSSMPCDVSLDVGVWAQVEGEIISLVSLSLNSGRITALKLGMDTSHWAERLSQHSQAHRRSHQPDAAQVGVCLVMTHHGLTTSARCWRDQFVDP